MAATYLRSVADGEGHLVPVYPEWLRVSEACGYSRLSKATLYDLINTGAIRSYSTRKPGQIKGTRLISFASLRDHLESNATGGRPTTTAA